MTRETDLAVLSEAGELEMSGSRTAFAVFADWVRCDHRDATFALAAPTALAEGGAALKQVEVRTLSGPGVAIKRERHSTLVIEAAPRELLWLAAVLEDFSTMAPAGGHFHLEYYPGHVALLPESTPVVLSLADDDPGFL